MLVNGRTDGSGKNSHGCISIHNIQGASGHWAHVVRRSVLTNGRAGHHRRYRSAVTIGSFDHGRAAHSHNPGQEEIWAAIHGDGLTLYPFGTAGSTPGNGLHDSAGS